LHGQLSSGRRVRAGGSGSTAPRESRLATCGLVAAGFTAFAAPLAHAGSIYIAGDGCADASVAALLSARGNQVTVGVRSVDLTGSVDLSTYDAVVLLNGTTFGQGICATGQQNLLDFVHNGGGIALTGWASYDHDVAGLDQMMSPLIPLERTGGAARADVYHVDVHSSITAGLPDMFVVPATGMNVGTGLRSSTASVAVSGAFGHRVVTDTYGQGRIVQFATAGDFGSYTPFDQGAASSNLNQLFAQGVEWAADAPAPADPAVTPLPGAATAGLVLIGGMGLRRTRRRA
jgi:hypothetical protein